MEGPGTTKSTGDFSWTPVECVSLILALTTPCDVCRSSAVSSAFLSAGASDFVWDRFLPPDYMEVLDRCSTPVMFSSKRELYFRLCDSVLVDHGKKMLWLEKPTGKKCYMLSARALCIIWGNDARYWRWISVPDARFPEVAELLTVCWLEIRTSISCRELSPGTRYGAYLVMRLAASSNGLENPPQETTISVGGLRSSTRRIRLDDRQPPEGIDEGLLYCVPRARGDGWMEVEMGDFLVEEAGDEETVEIKLKGWEGLYWKSGLLVHGVELRPIP